MQKLRSLEMVRAIAALLVVMFHTQWIFSARTNITPFGGIFSTGGRGLDLFFVLSGFIIGYVHAPDIGRPKRFGNYLFNRVARIYPAVLIMTAFSVALHLGGSWDAENASKLTAWNILQSALLLPQSGTPLVNVTWTLKYEVFFYLVFGMLILEKWIGLALLAGWQIAVVASSVFFYPETLGLVGFYLRPFSLEFSVGLGVAWLIKRPSFIGAMQGPGAQYALLTVGIAAFGGGMVAENNSAIASIACASGAGVIIVALILLEQSDRIWVPDFMVILGSASYSIYLVHFSTITLFATLLTRFHAIPMNEFIFLAAAAFGVVAGSAFYQGVDRPIQRFLRQRLKSALLCEKRSPVILSK